MNDTEYLGSLQRYWRRHHAFPSLTKLADVVGLGSGAGMFALVGRLTDAGYLERIEGGRIAPTKKFFARPLVGSVRAGTPEPAQQEEVELINVDDYLMPDPNRSIICRVKGDSMVGVGLLDGDLVVVEKNSPTKPGDIVVAIVDNEVTVKTLRMTRQGDFFLEAANPAYEPIHPAGSLEILGVVIGSFRRHRRWPSKQHLINTQTMRLGSRKDSLCLKKRKEPYADMTDVVAAYLEKLRIRSISYWQDQQRLYKDILMRVEVRCINDHGNPKETRDRVKEPGTIGKLQILEDRVHALGRFVRSARLLSVTDEKGTDVLPELLDVEIIQLNEGKMRLRGVERVDGAFFGQTWEIILLNELGKSSSGSKGK